jgi:large subunit ribosomal protein L19
MNRIREFAQKYNQRQVPEIKPGWTVRVYQRIKEGGKERVAPFEGIVIARKHGREAGSTFTVRRVISGIGVEKIFPLYSPTIEKIEVIKKAKVRRAKLYYLREKSKKETKKKIKTKATSKISQIPIEESKNS